MVDNVLKVRQRQCANVKKASMALFVKVSASDNGCDDHGGGCEYEGDDEDDDSGHDSLAAGDGSDSEIMMMMMLVMIITFCSVTYSIFLENTKILFE